MSKTHLLESLAIDKYGWYTRYVKSYRADHNSTQTYRSILANMIVKGDISLQMLEQEDYLRFLKHSIPELEMVSIDDIKSDYLTMKNFKKERAQKEMLARIGTGKICLMVETLKSEQPGLEIIRILANYIAKEEYGSLSWMLEELVLSLRQLQSPLNDDDLTEAILLCLSEWDIEDKISTITFINSSGYDSVAARVRNHLNKKKALPLDGRVFHVRCSKHILKSMAQLAMNEVYDVVNKLPKDRFGSFKTSDLEESWKSAYCMLEQTLTRIKSFQRSHYKDVLTKGELKKVEGTFSLIELIKKLADSCSPKKSYPTTYFHNFLVFRNQLAKESTSSDKFVSEVANKMLLLFNRFWEDMFMVMAMVMVIDPHFKLKYLEFFFSKYSGSDAKTSVELVREGMFDLYSEYMSAEQLKKANVPCNEPSAEQVEKANAPCDEEQFDDSNVSDSWFDEYFEAAIPESKSDLSDYFDKDLLIQPSLSYNVLSWWKFGNHDPTLSRMACDILAIGMSMTIHTPSLKFYRGVRAHDSSIEEAFLFKHGSTAPHSSYNHSWNSVKLQPQGPYHNSGTYDFEHGAESKDLLKCNDREIYVSKLAELIYCDRLPFVKDENFLALVDPEFKMVKMENVKTQILETYKRWKENVKKFLVGEDDHCAQWPRREKEKSPNRISLAIDKWRSTQGCEFLCITAHFIDSGWKFKKLMLSFVEVSVPLTLDNVTEKILSCISNWGIADKILSITSKNSFIFEDTSSRLQNCLREKVKLPFDGMFFRVRCCSDIFNEIAQQGLNEIGEIINKFHKVTPADDSLQNLQNDKQWDKTYLLLRKAIETRKTCSTSGVADTEVLSIDEWKKIEGICLLLKNIYDVESTLSWTEETTANDYFHYVCVVHAVLTQQSTSSDIFVSTVAKKMLERLDKYWKDMFMVLAIASFLDPKLRMKYFEYVLPKCADIDSSTLVTQVHEAVSSLYTEYKVTDVMKPTPAANLREKNFPYCPKNDGDIFNNALLKEYHDFVESQSTKSEWNQYLDDWTAYENDFCDALSWWGTYSDKYPTLSRMARDILAIPISVITNASLAPGYYSREPVIDSSAFFSKGRELDSYLSSLDPDIMEALICMRKWRRSDM